MRVLRGYVQLQSTGRRAVGLPCRVADEAPIAGLRHDHHVAARVAKHEALENRLARPSVWTSVQPAIVLKWFFTPHLAPPCTLFSRVLAVPDRLADLDDPRVLVVAEGDEDADDALGLLGPDRDRPKVPAEDAQSHDSGPPTHELEISRR